MSSFRRPEGRARGIASDKPSVASTRQHHVSSGLRELDQVLGGGIPLGAMVLISEDLFTNHAETIFNYMLSEAISQGHDVLVIQAPSRGGAAQLVDRLPLNLTALEADGGPVEQVVAQPRDMLGKPDLKIAWQYEKYLNKDSGWALGGSQMKLTQQSRRLQTPYCHSYDLAKKMQSNVIEMCGRFEVFSAPACRGEADWRPGTPSSRGLEDFLQQVYDRVAAFCESKSLNKGEPGSEDVAASTGYPASRKPLRVFLPALGGFDKHFSMEEYGPDRVARSVQLRRFILKLKHLTRNRDKGISVVLSTNKSCHADQQLFPSLTHIANVVLEIESFDGHGKSVPPEYRHFCAFFHVTKLSNINCLVPHYPAANQFGIKRSSRKLLIEALHLPPEEGGAEPQPAGAAIAGHSCSAAVTNMLNEI